MVNLTGFQEILFCLLFVLLAYLQGIGAMEEPKMIVSTIEQIINEQANKEIKLNEGDLI